MRRCRRGTPLPHPHPRFEEQTELASHAAFTLAKGTCRVFPRSIVALYFMRWQRWVQYSAGMGLLSSQKALGKGLPLCTQFGRLILLSNTRPFVPACEVALFCALILSRLLHGNNAP